MALNDRRNDDLANSDGIFSSAASRAAAAERRRLGLVETERDWTDVWGARIGRILAWIAVGAALFYLALTWGQAAEGWLDQMTPFDRGRVARLRESRRIGLDEAKAGAENDLKAVSALLAAEPQPIDPAKLSGKWRCRTIKLGGITPLTPYNFFECRINVGPDGTIALEKPTGSQRKRGRLVRMDDLRMLYVGASYYSYDAPPAYGSGPERDEAGVLVQVGPDRLRLELPEPHYESKHDVIELVRAK